MTRHCRVIAFTFLTACQDGPIAVFVMTTWFLLCFFLKQFNRFLSFFLLLYLRCSSSISCLIFIKKKKKKTRDFNCLLILWSRKTPPCGSQIYDP